MSSMLDMLGRGLDKPFVELILPFGAPLELKDANELAAQVAQDAEHLPNKLRLGLHYAQSGAWEQAERMFREILAVDEGNLDAQLGWAAMHLSAGSLEQGAETLRRAYDNGQYDSRVLFGLGYCCERQGQTEEAEEYYAAAAGARPYLRQPRERLAAMYLQRNEPTEAIAQCEALSKEHPEDVSVYLFLGQLQLQHGHYKAAIEAFERAITIEPDNFELHDDYVESLAKSGQLREAIEQMHRVIEEQEGFADNHVRLADLYCQVANDEGAVEHYHRALDLHPGYLEAAVKLGTQHLRMGRFYEAARQFNRAIEINNSLITAYVGLGIAQKYNAEEAAAQDTLELAAALEPNTNLLFAEMARLQLKVSLAQKSQRDYLSFEGGGSAVAETGTDLVEVQLERHRQSLLANPNYADLHYRYGLLLRGRGRLQEAIRHFRSAAQINPSYVRAKMHLGLALREAGELGEAIDQLKESLQVGPESVDLHYKLGLMYCDKMQFALAVEQLELVEQEDPANANVQANLALALQNMGLVDRARASWRAVCELEPESALAFKAQRELVSLKPVQ